MKLGMITAVELYRFLLVSTELKKKEIHCCVLELS